MARRCSQIGDARVAKARVPLGEVEPRPLTPVQSVGARSDPTLATCRKAGGRAVVYTAILCGALDGGLGMNS